MSDVSDVQPGPHTPGPSGPERPRSLDGPPPGTVIDRRLGLDRRARAGDDSASGLERRRGPGRRRSDFQKSAEEGELTREQFLFLMAVEAFKKGNATHFPTWSDVLEVVRLLGYRKTMPMELTLPNAEDWREPADAPSNVRTDRQRQRALEARQADEAVRRVEQARLGRRDAA